jgi:hypothetical protein
MTDLCTREEILGELRACANETNCFGEAADLIEQLERERNEAREKRTRADFAWSAKVRALESLVEDFYKAEKLRELGVTIEVRRRP